LTLLEKLQVNNLKIRLSTSTAHFINLIPLKKLYISLEDGIDYTSEVHHYYQPDKVDLPLQEIKIIAEYLKLSIFPTGKQNIIFNKETVVFSFELELVLFRDDKIMAPTYWKLNIVKQIVNDIFAAMELIFSKLKLFVINLTNVSMSYSSELKDIIDYILSSKKWGGDVNIIGNDYNIICNDYKITKIENKVTQYNNKNSIKCNQSFSSFLKFKHPVKIIFHDDYVNAIVSENEYQFEIGNDVIDLPIDIECIVFDNITTNIKVKTIGYLKNVIFKGVDSTITFENKTVIENLTLKSNSCEVIGEYTCIKLYCSATENICNINHIVKYSHIDIY
jgi:hypothetical protein